FMTQKTLYLLFLTPFLAGIGNSGFNVATVTYRYNIIPEEGHKTIYEGWFGAVFGLSALLGPMVGKLIMEILPPVRGPIFQYSNFQIMYLISFIVGLSVVLLMFFRPLKKQQKPDS
ncbi:MAG: MFS transporter, partial [Candidatus Atribacteria bacterium]|nr:MFS transporter [Candidatus Atribacteria bacterium]